MTFEFRDQDRTFRLGLVAEHLQVARLEVDCVDYIAGAGRRAELETQIRDGRVGPDQPADTTD